VSGVSKDQKFCEEVKNSKIKKNIKNASKLILKMAKKSNFQTEK
jgi:hypothetical protein